MRESLPSDRQAFMPDPKQERLEETELIAWAIPLIADGCYSTQVENETMELTVYDDEPTLEFMEGALLYKRKAHEIAALKKAKEECTPENIRECCVAYLGAVLGPEIAQQIEIPEYWRLVLGIFLQERALIRSIQKVFVYERERLSSEDMERIESGALSEALKVNLVAAYARELAELFPQLIERATSLSILPATSSPAKQVQHYIAEATKCFIYGRFISSLVMCRGALEEGIRDLIGRLNLEDEFGHFPPRPKEGDLARMIRFCEKKPVLGVSWGIVDQIRRAANKAVHGSPPDPQRCRASFEDTRSVLLQIYSLKPNVAGR